VKTDVSFAEIGCLPPHTHVVSNVLQYLLLAQPGLLNISLYT